MMLNKDNMILEHYKNQALKYGETPFSTMEDQTVRNKEIELIKEFIKTIITRLDNKKLKVLDIGCGNGYTLENLSKDYSALEYWGVEFTEELLKIAKERNLETCNLIQGDVRQLSFEDNLFDIIYTERCLINILDWEEQKKAIDEIYRILKPNKYYLMIECFEDGLNNNNKARRECGLQDIKEASHNKYFEKELLFNYIRNKFDIINPESLMNDTDILKPNFLSSHYFIARVFHPLVTKGENIKNTEFVKFFSTALPPIGNYSPVQAYILKKI